MKIILFIGILLLAIFSGILINYISDIFPSTRKFSKPFCNHCAKPLGWGEYLGLKQCLNCHQRSKKRYIIIFLVTFLLVLLLWFFPPNILGFWLAYPILIFFCLIFIIDMEHRLILNQFVLAGIVLLLPMGIFMLEKVNPLLKSIGISLLGGVAGYLLMLGLYYFGGLFSRLVSKLRGEEIEEIALGYGDVNLTAILGLLLGWPKIGITLLFAIILAGIFSGFYLLISVILKKYQAFSAIPYAPFLLIAATVMIYYA